MLKSFCVAITGAGGMAMQAFCGILKESSIPHIAFTKNELDVIDQDAVRRILEKNNPDWLVNGAAYTKVDGAEIEKIANRSLNEEAPKILASLCSEFDVNLLHISTDYVFDGSKTTPYKEEDSCSPLSEYGLSKRAGEIAVLESSSQNLVVRTSGLYGAVGYNFVHAILNKARLGKRLKVVDDQKLSPTWTIHLGNALIELIDHKASGVVHFSNREECSWYEFAEKILEEALDRKWIGSKAELIAIKTVELKQPARRPPYSVLDCSRYEKLNGKTRPIWRVALSSYFDSYTEFPS